MVGTRGVIAISLVQSVRAVGMYADGKVHPECCLARRSLTFSCGGVQIELGNRSTATAVHIRFVALKCDKKGAGCTITHARLSNERETGGGGGMGAFEVLLELLVVHPHLPVEAPLTVRATSQGQKVFTGTQAVTALRLMVGCSGRDPLQFALHSGGKGGATQLAVQGISE